MRKTLWKVGLTTAAVVLLSSSSAYAQAMVNAGLNVHGDRGVARAAYVERGGDHLRGRGPDRNSDHERRTGDGRRRRAHGRRRSRHA